MSEEKKEKGSWFEGINQIKKIHPVALILALVCMTLSSRILSQNMPLEDKLLPYILSFTLAFLTMVFECYRINKEAEAKERGLAKEGSW